MTTKEVETQQKHQEIKTTPLKSFKVGDRVLVGIPGHVFDVGRETCYFCTDPHDVDTIRVDKLGSTFLIQRCNHESGCTEGIDTLIGAEQWRMVYLDHSGGQDGDTTGLGVTSDVAVVVKKVPPERE